jgi:hypothetical protein
VTFFGHVSVFLSIVIGLAVVHLLSGVSLMLDARVRTRVYGIHLAWVVAMLVVSVLVWVSSFVLSPLAEIGALHVFNLLAYAVVVYLMSGLLFPVRGAEVTDFREHFRANRSRFYLCGVAYTLVDAADGIHELTSTDLPLDVGQFATLSVWCALFLIGLGARSDRFDVVVIVGFAVGLVGWLVSLIQTGVLAA